MAGFGNSKNQSDDVPLCANNCIYYGYPKTLNLCSLCYAAFLKRTAEDSRRRSLGGTERELDLGLRRSLSTSESFETSESAVELKYPAGNTKNRCKMCKKKIGLLGFNCRCGDSFCGKHRYPEEHCCDFDHKAAGREILAEQIVECKADKLEFRV